MPDTSTVSHKYDEDRTFIVEVTPLNALSPGAPTTKIVIYENGGTFSTELNALHILGVLDAEVLGECISLSLSTLASDEGAEAAATVGIALTTMVLDLLSRQPENQLNPAMPMTYALGEYEGVTWSLHVQRMVPVEPVGSEQMLVVLNTIDDGHTLAHGVVTVDEPGTLTAEGYHTIATRLYSSTLYSPEELRGNAFLSRIAEALEDLFDIMIGS